MGLPLKEKSVAQPIAGRVLQGVAGTPMFCCSFPTETEQRNKVIKR